MANATNLQPNGQPTVSRTRRGLTVAGTRITLYAIMDFIKEDSPPKLIRHKFNLTERQMADVLAYIDEHRDEVAAGHGMITILVDHNIEGNVVSLRGNSCQGWLGGFDSHAAGHFRGCQSAG